MTARSAKPVTVTLGPLAEMAQVRVRSGRYASVSEVVRAGLRALEREEQALDEVLRSKVAEALADTDTATVSTIQHDDLFSDLRAHHARHGKPDVT